MLTTWTPAHMPEKEEIKTRLQTARSQLYDFQMKIKEHKIPVIVLFEGWGSSGKGSTIGKVIGQCLLLRGFPASKTAIFKSLFCFISS